MKTDIGAELSIIKKDGEKVKVQGCLDSGAEVSCCPKSLVKYATKTEEIKHGMTMEVKLPDGTTCELLKKIHLNMEVWYDGTLKPLGTVHCWVVSSKEWTEVLIGKKVLKYHNTLPEQNLLVRTCFKVGRVQSTGSTCDSNSFSEILNRSESEGERPTSILSEVEPEEESSKEENMSNGTIAAQMEHKNEKTESTNKKMKKQKIKQKVKKYKKQIKKICQLKVVMSCHVNITQKTLYLHSQRSNLQKKTCKNALCL